MPSSLSYFLIKNMKWHIWLLSCCFHVLKTMSVGLEKLYVARKILFEAAEATAYLTHKTPTHA